MRASGEVSRPLDDVFAHVDANRELFVGRLADWVRRPSVSATDENLDLHRFHTGVKTAAAMLAHLGAAGGDDR